MHVRTARRSSLRPPRPATRGLLALALAAVPAAAAPVRAEAPPAPAGVPPALWERVRPLLEAGAASPPPAYHEAERFTGSEADPSSFFGSSLAVDGDTAVIGAMLDGEPPASGAAYVFQRDVAAPGVWSEVARLLPSGAAVGDSAGFAVAIAGDTVAVGAPFDDDHGGSSGSVYLFERDAGGPDAWGEVARLTASDAAADDLFGSAVAVAGGTVAVGAPQDDDLGANSGSVYVFERDAGGPGAWGETAELAASDAAAGTRFGSAVAIAGDRLAVGAPTHFHLHDTTFSLGAVYLFERDAGGEENWGEVKEVTAPVSTPQVSFARFGEAVALAGDRMAVGAPNQGDNAGSVFVHERDAGGPGAWGEVARITVAAEGPGRDEFGQAVAIEGDLLAVGRETVAYLYQRNTGGPGAWGELSVLQAAEPEPENRLGHAVGIAGETILVAAPGPGPFPSDPGFVYRFAPAADLAVLVDDGVGSVAPGGATTYAVAVVNAGPSAVSAAKVEDLFPPSLSCTWSCSAGSGATCTPGPAAGDLVDAVGLPAGGFAIYLAACAVDPTASGSLVNTATVTPPVTRADFDAGNNAATDTDGLMPAADLALGVASSADPVPPDGELTYTLTVINQGPSPAADVAVSALLPPGVGLVSATGCTEEAGVVVCIVGDLGSGAAAEDELLVQVALDAPQVLDLSATVGSATPDPEPANDVAAVSTVHDLEAPSVGLARAVGDPETGGGTLVPCTSVLAAPVALDLTFSEPMYDPPGDDDPEDVTHPPNYLLVTPGPDLGFQTAGCAGGPQGDDVAVGIADVTYDGATATARLALAAPAPSLLHRLYVSDALRDLPGNAFDGDGDGAPGGELALPFRVDDGNLFADGHFDCDLGGWLATDPTAIGHRPDRDFESSPESGAAAIAGDAPFALGRCLPLAGGRVYGITARARLEAAADDATVTADCRLYPGGSCLGPVSPAPPTQITLERRDVWESLEGAFEAPAGTASALCVFTLAGDAFEVSIDGLDLRDRTLFSDGFESGDTSAWSTAVE